MRTIFSAILLFGLIAWAGSVPAEAGPWTGKIKLGGIILDEEGDLSTVQETYNIYDGFSVTQVRLDAVPGEKHYLRFDLREVNLDSRRGDLLYRVPGKFRFTASYDQHRQVFDALRGTNSERKDLGLGTTFNPTRWLSLTGNFGYLTRDGERLSFPDGTASALGTGYDNVIITGGVGAEVRKDRRGIAVDYRISDFQDDRNAGTDRTGQVISARVFAPSMIYDRWTHLLRGSYGVSELSTGGRDYTLSRFQYTGVVTPDPQFRFKYGFDAQRVDHETTRLKTDRFQNDLDATYYYGKGSFSAGYGYELNDDDRSLTSYHNYRLGTTFRHDKTFTARLRYAGRVKKDTEELTLLKDVEASRFRGNVEVRPVDDLLIHGGFNVREREFPDINVKSDGSSYTVGSQFTLPHWGAASGTYTYAKDEYQDLAGSFDADNHNVTGRLDFNRIADLRLSTGLTFLKAGKDLDIEKSILFFEGEYALVDDLAFEVKYNVYNYDDFIVLDRYYTANVVWLNVAYNLHLK